MPSPSLMNILKPTSNNYNQNQEKQHPNNSFHIVASFLALSKAKSKMPPELPSSHSLVTPLRHPILSKPRINVSPTHKSCRRMNLITTKKLIPTVVFVLIIASLLRFLKITLITSSPPPSASPTLLNINKNGPSLTSQPNSSSKQSLLTEKELRFLSDIIFKRAPCNLLVFGMEEQYLVFSFINAGGTTIFLEDNPEKLSTIQTNFNTTRAHRVEYKYPAKDAFKLLKNARGNPTCSPQSGLRKESKCKLELTELPKEVYEIMWDVIVVDGPSGDGLEAPGRMAAIFTASMLARTGNITNVVVHDVHRMVEKWFSWEFLCEENLVSTKGKFWNFRIGNDQSNSTRFCL